MNPPATSPYLPISEYLPHRGAMALLDRVVEAEPKRIVCSLALHSGSAFCREGRVPSYVGVEYMAQAAGALIGWGERAKGMEPRVGFLVAIRKYNSRVDGFAAGDTLAIEAKEILRDDDNGLGVMTGAIYHPDGSLLATGQLTAYLPKDLGEFLTKV